MCERFPETPAAEAARRELAEMREMLARERDELIPFTPQFLAKVHRGSVSDAASATRREVEADAIRAALRATEGDVRRAAARLGLDPGVLEARMEALGIEGDDPSRR